MLGHLDSYQLSFVQKAQAIHYNALKTSAGKK
jgi:hypothetical protein